MHKMLSIHWNRIYLRSFEPKKSMRNEGGKYNHIGQLLQ